MPLTTEEKAQATALAKGMLLAQKDNMSLAGNLLNNPHFTNVPHSVKLDALRQYASMEDEGDYKSAVNVEPNRMQMAKGIARAALMEGAVSLPVSAAIGLAGTQRLLAGRLDPNDVLYNMPGRSLKSAGKRMLPLAGLLFGANAAVGGIREGLRQRAVLQQAQVANRYLDQIRKSSTDDEIYAMLLGASGNSDRILRKAKDSERSLDRGLELASNELPVISPRSYSHPEETMIANALAGEIIQGQQDIDNYGSRHFQQKQASLNQKPSMKTPKKKWTSKNARVNAQLNKAKVEAAKIRVEQLKNYEAALDKGTTHNITNDVDAQYRLAKATVKKFLRV